MHMKPYQLMKKYIELASFYAELDPIVLHAFFPELVAYMDDYLGYPYFNLPARHKMKSPKPNDARHIKRAPPPRQSKSTGWHSHKGRCR